MTNEKEPFRCVYCGSTYASGWRGSYAGNNRYHNDVQCGRHGCWQWQTVPKNCAMYVEPRKEGDAT